MNISKMRKLLCNDEFEIFKDTRIDTSFYIMLKKPNFSLLKSLTRTHIILGGSIIDNYQTLHFKISSLQSYQEYRETLYKRNRTKTFPYTTALKLSYYLSKQMNYLLNEENKCFYEFNPEYIMVIDESKFIYLGGSQLLDLQENYIQIQRPFILKTKGEMIDFVSPELLEIKQIPCRLHFKTLFYSLACLLIYSLSNDIINDIINDITNSQEEIEELLKPIKETKLYWLIKRCLEREPEKRLLLLL